MQSKFLINFESKHLKIIFFLLLVFPYINHIYSAVFPIIYNNQIAYISIFLLYVLSLITLYQNKIKVQGDILYFLPFLVVALISSVYEKNFEIFKYLSYVIIYFYLFKNILLEKYIFKLYVNILVGTFILLFITYLLTIQFSLYEFFKTQDLNFLGSNSPMHNVGHRSQVFYFLVFDYYDFSGILPVQRFYGYSREPGLYVVLIIPAFLMASYFKMRVQMIILAFAVFVTSSIAGYVVVAMLFFLSLFSTKKFIPLLILSIIIFSFAKDYIYLLNSERANNYLDIQFGQIYTRFSLNFQNSINMLIDGFFKTDNGKLVPFTKSQFSSILFICEKLSFIVIIYSVYNKIHIINSKVVYLFFLAVLILIGKGSEFISPLFLFYLTFIDYVYKDKLLQH
jgi:hypothetical protein